MWGPQSRKLLLSNKNYLFTSALPLNCSPITIVKSMDHTWEERFHLHMLPRMRQASVTRPLSPECNQPSLSMAPAVFPSISFTWAAPRFAWAKYLGNVNGSVAQKQKRYPEFATYGCCAKLEISFKQRRHVLTSARFCPSLQQTVWNTIELRHMTWLRSLCQNRLK